MFYVDWPNWIRYLFIAFDIIAVAFIVFYVIIYVFNTRTINILKGFGAFLLAFFIAMFFQLKTLLWIFEKTFEVLPLAILIVFQPEIRRIMINLGTLKIFTSILEPKLKESRFKTVEEILKAVKVLSKKKIGALIVMQRENPLAHIKDKAVELDAVVSEPLLYSIFNLASPLHDGAVIIKDNKLTVARAFFPITEDKISTKFGARHRAAIGITELTDAFTIVVSEETGRISLTNDGKIEINIGHEKLRTKTLELSGIKNEKKPR